MTRHTALPSETEVRALVARIVDGILADAPTTNQPPPEPAPPPPDGATPETASIAIGADHGGYPLKERLAFKLREAGYEVFDCGTDSHDSVDYPDFAHAVATRVAEDSATYGIIIDGAGIGSAMVANKVPGVRAAPCHDLSSARNSREHNHANVLTLGAGLVGDALAWQITQEWLATAWAGGRHARRVAKIDEIEQRYVGARA